MRGAGIIPAGISADIEGAEEKPRWYYTENRILATFLIQLLVETQPRSPRGNNRPERYKY